MCTMTFWPQPDGYRIGMNRDEQRSRILAAPPSRHPNPTGWHLHPAEPAGGTWISVNDFGVSFGLINWYSLPHSSTGPRQSRGRIVASLAASRIPEDVEAFVRPDALFSTPPFRLVGWFPNSRRILEWRWNGGAIESVNHDWKPGQWISSGRDEPGAQRIRSSVFQAHQNLVNAGSASWMRRLHASHEPEEGAHSICMHRTDAVTVSYTEIVVTSSRCHMRYHPGSPCAPAPATAGFLLRKHI